MQGKAFDGQSSGQSGIDPTLNLEQVEAITGLRMPDADDVVRSPSEDLQFDGVAPERDGFRMVGQIPGQVRGLVLERPFGAQVMMKQRAVFHDVIIS